MFCATFDMQRDNLALIPGCADWGRVHLLFFKTNIGITQHLNHSRNFDNSGIASAD